MHENIHRFFLDGKIDDENLVQTKDTLIRSLEEQMRDAGYVPVLDIEPQFTLVYNQQTMDYDFTLTIYGTWMGKEAAWSTGGMIAGKPVPRYTRRDKSSPSWTI